MNFKEISTTEKTIIQLDIVQMWNKDWWNIWSFLQLLQNRRESAAKAFLTQFSWETYSLLRQNDNTRFGQTHLSISRNTFSNLDKYIWPNCHGRPILYCGKMITHNLGKYIYQFEEIHFPTWTNTFDPIVMGDLFFIAAKW